MNNTAAGASPVDCRVRPMVERLRMDANTSNEAAMAIDAALHEAIAAVYFDDGSDFKPALRRLVSILGGHACLRLLEENPRACYAASAA